MKIIGFLSMVVGSVVLALATQACGNEGPKPINYGSDQCAHCKMTVSDARFGCQLATEKGRAYNFDDVQCMVAFVKSDAVAAEDVAEYYLPDYVNEHRLLPAEQLLLLKSESLKSPMRGDVAAFSTPDDLASVREVHGGAELMWRDLWE